MKLVVLAILVGIVLSTSSFTINSSAEQISQEIPNQPLKSILKKNGTINTIREKPDFRVRFNSTCKWSGITLLQFKEVTNSSVRMFLQEKVEGITDTDCTLYYRVDNSDGERPFLLFRIDRQVPQNILRRSPVYGILSSDDAGNFTWKASRRRQFEHYVAWCDRKDGSSVEAQLPQMSRYLSCGQTQVTPSSPQWAIPTTHATRVIPTRDFTRTTPAKRVLWEVPETTPFPRITSPRGVTPKKSTRRGLLSMLNCFSSNCL
ncbi:hypothetical protein GCK32_005707 [Trichostrongylus colubriformis]|uniref:Secreted protein n=1 Tax=Trichostrongylus colubriformis TaxID=6319 RepID=A0AAN8FB63_TRICO